MNGTLSRPTRIFAARGFALLATKAVGIGAAALFAAPDFVRHGAGFGTAAQAQNLTDKVQQLAQRPVGFADIVEKVKPAVISVRVKMERPADSDANNNDDLPF